jgi:hypothetical protein
MSLSKILALATLLAAAACTPKDQPAMGDAMAASSAPAMASASSATAAASASAASSAVPATAANDPLPSHADVAKKVRGEVTKQNYKAELDKLEKEIE